jgi:hypothetical protein
MADNDPIIIGNANTASNPGNETSLSRNEATPVTVFVARNLNAGDGIYGRSVGRIGVTGQSDTGVGVHAQARSGRALQALSDSDYGVFALGGTGIGVYGRGWRAGGVFDGADVIGIHVIGGAGVFEEGVQIPGGSLSVASGISASYASVAGRVSGGSGNFTGPVTAGSITSSSKQFKIDHPLDPENQYLLHSCVESSEMKNVYDGVAQLDEDGSAWVELPEWFEALNADFRYQLTAIGGAASNLHVAEELSENRFKIAGGEGGMKICWQVTGSRKDRWAQANPLEVEQEKPEEERGRYLEPGLYDAPEEQRVMLGPIPEAEEEDFARLEEERLRQLDELRRGEEEQRREMEELRRLIEPQEEAPPEERT